MVTRPITEAEYAAYIDFTMHRLADELTAALPQELRDAGMRIEWLGAAAKGDAAAASPPAAGPAKGDPP